MLQAQALAEPDRIARETRNTLLLAIAVAQGVAEVLDSVLSEPAA